MDKSLYIIDRAMYMVDTWERHLNDVDMTYIQHLVFALSLSRKLSIGAIRGLIHGLFPGLYVTSVSDLVAELNQMLKEAHMRSEGMRCRL